jgi:hypothetical protein
MVSLASVSYRDVALTALNGGPADLQGVLHSNTAVHLRFRRAGRGITET